MGFSPGQVDRMTLWQFVAISEGVAEARGSKKHGDDLIEYEDHDLRAMGVEGF